MAYSLEQLFQLSGLNLTSVDLSGANGEVAVGDTVEGATLSGMTAVQQTDSTDAISIKGSDSFFSGIYGGKGKGVLTAGGKGAVLYGGGGNDTLVGGSGKDTFILASGDGDIIVSKVSDKDVVRLFDKDISDIKFVKSVDKQSVSLSGVNAEVSLNGGSTVTETMKIIDSSGKETTVNFNKGLDSVAAIEYNKNGGNQLYVGLGDNNTLKGTNVTSKSFLSFLLQTY